jgi:WD40 repeat protein
VIETRVLSHPGVVWRLRSFRAPDGGVRLLAVGDVILAWDPVTGEQVAAFDDVQSSWNDVEVCHPVGRDPVVAVATEDGVEWFDALTGARCYPETTSDTVWGLAAARMPDGTDVLFGAGYMGPYPILRWDAATGGVLPDLGEHDDHIVAVAAVALPDGSVMVAATGWSHTIHRWNPATGAEYGRPLVGHTSIVHYMDAIALPDGRVLLASGDSEGVVRRWDAVTGDPVGTAIKAHPEEATVLGVRIAGRPQLLTSGADQVIRRWDAVTGELLDEPGAGFNPVLLTVGGTRAIAAGGPGGLVVGPLRLS